jgi:glutamine cyclotransferase
VIRVPRRTGWLLLPLVLVAASILPDVAPAPYSRQDARAQEPSGYVVKAVYPHDPEAFTQGLAFRKNTLFEGTGLEGLSSLRRVHLQSGEVKREHALPDRYFGEGITVVGDEIFQITWLHGRGWVYDAKTFERVRSFTYEGEGWGLTDNERRLAMSDGTDIIRFRNPRTFEVTREIHVTEGGTPVPYLNELEWVQDEIFANVFSGDDVVRIDPRTGDVTGRFSLNPLHEREAVECHPDVTNGIAYMDSRRSVFVTGKYWCHVYEIELTNPAGA